MFTRLRATAAVAALLATTSAAAAATVTATFDFTQPGPAYWRSSYTFTNAGTTLKIKAHNYNSHKEIYRDIRVGRWTGWGLGAGYRGDSNHRVDGRGRDEVLSFAFDRSVTLENIEFGAYYANSKFDYFADNGGALAYDSWGHVADNVVLSSNNTGIIFGIGASCRCSAFKVRSLTVSWDDGSGNPAPVPLPAGGLMLLSGLAAVGGARKFKRKS